MFPGRIWYAVLAMARDHGVLSGAAYGKRPWCLCLGLCMKLGGWRGQLAQVMSWTSDQPCWLEQMQSSFSHPIVGQHSSTLDSQAHAAGCGTHARPTTCHGLDEASRCRGLVPHVALKTSSATLSQHLGRDCTGAQGCLVQLKGHLALRGDAVVHSTHASGRNMYLCVRVGYGRPQQAFSWYFIAT